MVLLSEMNNLLYCVFFFKITSKTIYVAFIQMIVHTISQQSIFRSHSNDEIKLGQTHKSGRHVFSCFICWNFGLVSLCLLLILRIYATFYKTQHNCFTCYLQRINNTIRSIILTSFILASYKRYMFCFSNLGP